jgi:hypothetical protein
MPPQLRKSRRTDGPSSANGGSNAIERPKQKNQTNSDWLRASIANPHPLVTGGANEVERKMAAALATEGADLGDWRRDMHFGDFPARLVKH